MNWKNRTVTSDNRHAGAKLGLALSLMMMLFLFSSMIHKAKAWADEDVSTGLTVAVPMLETEERLSSDPLASDRRKALSYIDANKSKYNRDIPSSKKNNLSRLCDAVSSAKTLKAIAKAKTKASSIFATAKKLHKYKAKLSNKTEKLFRKYQHLMNSAEKKIMKNTISRISAATTKAKAKAPLKKRNLAVARAKMSKHVSSAHSWSKKKLAYVSKWAKRNNAYLSRTKMHGTGYHIASSAYDHDMDPRLCAAIARVESNCGQAPYRNRYNVWGWIWRVPTMYSWPDAIEKWTSYFSSFWGGERYPIKSMHGYGGYGPGYVNAQMAKI